MGVLHHPPPDQRSLHSLASSTQNRSQSSQQDTFSTRPTSPCSENSVQTRYINMLLGIDTIPKMHTIYAAFCQWILLAGFIIFPGTFTSLSSSQVVADNAAAETVLETVQNVPLIYVAAVCCGVGALGLVGLWWTWRTNFVWIINKIFMPGMLNSLAGLVGVCVNVYSQQGGTWSVTATITAIVTAGIIAVTGFLFLVYNFGFLRSVQRRHEMELAQINAGERFVEKM